MTNPANAEAQVLGVFDKKWVEPLAEVLRDLGCACSVVHGADGLDEITLTGESQVAELKKGKEVKSYKMTLKNSVFKTCSFSEDLKGGTPEENAAINDREFLNREKARKEISFY